MKLISCHVEGYGALEKQEYTFAEGITSFCQENGTGKSTLASFIKAMFYGLENNKKTKFCDREHFAPFKGGRFGGHLTFEKDGKTYKIERYFAGRSTGDTLKVYCNGEVTEELGEDIGKTVFGVDEDSFLRTLFIGSDEIEMQSTSSINAKLGSFLQGIEEEDGYDDALKKLDDARKSYLPDRRGKNATERIPLLEKEMETLKNEIDNAKTIQSALDGKYARMESLKEEIDTLNRQIVTAQEENERLKAFEHYDSLTESIAVKERKAAEICARYPMGLPTEEETLAVNSALMKEKETLAAAGSVEFSVKDSEKLARLEESFARGVPTEKEILEVEREIDALKTLETEIAIVGAKEMSASEKALSQKFMYECPTQEQLLQLSDKVEQYKQAKKEYESMPSVVAAPATDAGKQSKKGAPILSALAAILCGISAIFFGSGSTSVGIAFLAVGGVMLLAVGLLYGKTNTQQTATMSTLNPEKQRKEEELRELEYSLKAILTRYGYHSDNGVVYDFAQLQDDVTAYGQYVFSEKERQGQLAEKQAKKQALEDKLTAFFRGYGLSGDGYGKLLSDLRGMVREYYSLQDRQNAHATRVAELKKTLDETRVKIEAYKRKYGLTELRISDVLEDVREYNRLCVEIEREKALALAYKEKEGLAEKSTGERVDLGELQTLLTEKQNERSKLEREIAADETEAEGIYEKQAKLAEAE